MGSAHRASCCQDAGRVVAVVGILVDIEDAGAELIADVIHIGFLVLDAGPVVPALGRPGVDVVGVAAEHLNPSCVNELLCTVDHSLVFVVEESSVLGREYEDRFSGMSVNLELHIPAEVAAVFLVVFCLHFFFAFFLAGCSVTSSALRSTEGLRS